MSNSNAHSEVFLKVMLARSLLLSHDVLMKTLNLLLASSDRRSANLVQAVVLDACYNQAAVQTIRTSRMDELIGLGCRDGIDLIVLTPNHLQSGGKSGASAVTVEDVAQAVGTLKRYSVRPAIAVDVRAQDEMLFRNAGIDGVFCFPFDGGALKARVRRLLRLEDSPQPLRAEKPSLAGLLLRGFQRLKSA